MPASLPDIDSLSLAQQVAQLFVVRSSGHLFDSEIEFPDWDLPNDRLKHLIGDRGVGGIILVGGSAAELALRTQQFQELAEIPLLVSADIEEGVGQRFSGATWFPPPMALEEIYKRDRDRALDYAKRMGEATAKEAIAIGINWILAPVVDVNNNAENPVINVRSFGQTPEVVSALATAYIRGVHRHPVLACAKHFPGHGDTSVDSHWDLPTINHDETRLQQIEIPPFKAAIAAGVDSVMSAHLAIPAWDSQHPATLSKSILTGRLRQQLGFEGIIVTDALVMGAIAKRYDPGEAAILAIEAGADIVLMSADPEGAIDAVCNAVESGRISRQRLRESVDRLWNAKQTVGANVGRANAVRPYTFTPEAQQTATNILRDSQTVGESLPWKPDDRPWRNLIIVDDLLYSPFLSSAAPAIAIPAKLGGTLQRVDRHTASIPNSDDRTLVQAFIRGNPFGTSAQLIAMARDWVKELLKNGQLAAIAIYGSPYAIEALLADAPADLPYVFSYGQMPAAQAIALKTLLGEDCS